MNKTEYIIAQSGIYSMLALVVIVIILPAYKIFDEYTLYNIVFYLAPTLTLSILISIIICIRDATLRFTAGKKAKWIILLIILNVVSCSYYLKNYARKPRT